MTPSHRAPLKRLLPRALRLSEFLALYGGGPLLVLALRQPGILFAGLWVGAIIAWRSIRERLPVSHDVHREIRAVFIRFGILGSALTILAYFLWPTHFLDLPRHRPGFWLVIMGLYPLLSVWPQEMLYRGFLFYRYQSLFVTPTRRILASAITFAFAHVIFLNWIAIALTFVGGFLFARDYERHRSLRLACLEHSLYGCLIFTIGMGRFFYTGTAWHHG